VGHLQANKARRVVRLAEVVHSVDSLALLERVGRIAEEEGRTPEVYLQVALTGEAVKHGFEPADLPAAVARAADLSHVKLAGLMAMGPLEDAPGAATRAVFRQAAALARDLEREPSLARAFDDGRCHLSMGMSNDLEIAIEEGSDLLRIGSALFQDTPLAGREAGRGSAS
jgi:pyridoxal phosphate enzyme (YggS family)